MLELIWDLATAPLRLQFLWPILFGGPVLAGVAFPLLRGLVVRRHGDRAQPVLPGYFRIGLVVAVGMFLVLWAFIALGLAALLIVPRLFGGGG